MNKELIEKFNLIKNNIDESHTSTIEEINKFEKKHKVTFPDEYKYFLINVGVKDLSNPRKYLAYLTDETQNHLDDDCYWIFFPIK